MTLLNFRATGRHRDRFDKPLARFATGSSIEVMPRTAAKVPDFRALLPQGTRVYIAHIQGTPIRDMVATAARLRAEGFEPMPHFPARLINDRTTLSDWIARYQGEADVHQALVLAGGVSAPCGQFDNAMELLDTGLFDRAGFTRLHVAGHPEGNRDIDPDGGDTHVQAALRWKQRFSTLTNAQMALVTQFCFDPAPVLGWARDLQAAGVDMPIHVGVAGPAKLQTLIRFAIACGVGPSLSVLQKRARDVTKLLRPFEPTDLVRALAEAHTNGAVGNIAQLHLFPLGGIPAAAKWLSTHTTHASPRASQG